MNTAARRGHAPRVRDGAGSLTAGSGRGARCPPLGSLHVTLDWTLGRESGGERGDFLGRFGGCGRRAGPSEGDAAPRRGLDGAPSSLAVCWCWRRCRRPSGLGATLLLHPQITVTGRRELGSS